MNKNSNISNCHIKLPHVKIHFHRHFNWKDKWLWIVANKSAYTTLKAPQPQIHLMYWEKFSFSAWDRKKTTTDIAGLVSRSCFFFHPLSLSFLFWLQHNFNSKLLAVFCFSVFFFFYWNFDCKINVFSFKNSLFRFQRCESTLE